MPQVQCWTPSIHKTTNCHNSKSKEINMFTKRLFNLIVTALLMVVVSLVPQQARATRAIVPDTNSGYTQSREQALREVQLGERDGEIPENPLSFSAEQIRREYFLGERYGQIPEDFAQRHWTELGLSRSPDSTDYFIRHPELSVLLESSTDTTD